MQASDIKHLRELEEENRRLKQISADLSAAVAIAIARTSDSSIADESNLYTNALDSPAEQFFESTRVTAKLSDYRSAANYSKPKSSAIEIPSRSVLELPVLNPKETTSKTKF